MRSEHRQAWIPRASFEASLSRRGFLQGLGLVAGAAALGPLLRTRAWRESSRIDVTRPGLGTWMRVVARHRDPALASRAVDAACAAVDGVDRQMSIHRPDSDLSGVNRRSGESSVAVPRALLDVVTLAREGARRSDGVYDPTVLPLLRLYGFYGPARDRRPTDREIDRALGAVDWRSIVLDREHGRLGLARAGAALDLGSIGKGWAVDRAVDALLDAGIRDGMVDAGGNLYAFGAPEEGAPGWSIGIYHPVTRSVDRVLLLRDQAVATSGNYEVYRVLGGVRVGHLFDARRGRPADGHLSATVRADTAVQADLMSTASFLLGPDRFDWPEARDVHWIG